MKVQELLPGSKPKPSPSSRAARGQAVEANPLDFAGALSEARRKPESKPAPTDTASAKKPAPAKKQKASKDRPAPTEDAIGAEDATVADDTSGAPAAADAQTAENTEAPIATDDSAEPAESEQQEADAGPIAVALTQATGPQAPIAAPSPLAEAAAEDAPSAPSAPGKPAATLAARSVAPPTLKAVEGDEESADAPETAPDAAGIIIDGLDEEADEETDESPLAIDSIDTKRDAGLAKAPARPAAAPTAPAPSAEATAPEHSAKPSTHDEPLPAISSEFAMAADLITDDADLAPVQKGGADVNISPATTANPALPGAAKAQAAVPAPPSAPLPPQAQFIELNHPKIVTAVRGELLPQGGTMQIRLDPPELGALMVSVHMLDGVMTASFHTSNDDATKLLSHSLSQLKQVLESQGVSVEKLHVQQSPRDQQAANDDQRDGHSRDQQGDAHRQEQQRKDLLRRMWRRLSNGSDPLDLVA